MQNAAVVTCILLAMPNLAVVNAQQNPNQSIKKLLEKAGNAPNTEKLAILQKIVKLLPKRNRLENDMLTHRFAELLSKATTSPKEVRKLLGAPALIVRQIVYRRFREQWHYSAPLRLLVMVETRQGRTPTILTVQPQLQTKP